MSFLYRYKKDVASGALKADALQGQAAEKLQTLSNALRKYKPGWSLFGTRKAPRGLYIWGDVGRGKSMLMDLFFEFAPVTAKRRAHFNAFMVDVHARIHAERQKPGVADPIPPVARAVASAATLLCFDEFQVTDVADAMILGRLFEQLFSLGTVIVATSNMPPDRLYEGGINRQLFLPFIAEIKQRLDVVVLNGPTDYRLAHIKGLNVYLMPLSADSEKGMDDAWARL